MEKYTQKTYLDWSFEGRKSIVLYCIGFLFVLITSLFIGQMFVAAGRIIPFENKAVNIIKITFFGFIFSFLIIPMVIAVLHKRPWWSIAMPFKKIEYKNFFIGFGIVIAINMISTVIGYFINPASFAYAHVNLTDWILLFFLALIGFFIQAGTEEMVYRGYISQFVYRLTKNPIAAIILSSIVFAFPHIGNISGVSGIHAVLPYIIMGIAYGWLAYRSGSLWMSTGAHLANNWFITLFVGSSAEKIDKLSLFTKVNETLKPSSFTTSSLMYCGLIILLCELAMKIFKPKVSG